MTHGVIGTMRKTERMGERERQKILRNRKNRNIKNRKINIERYRQKQKDTLMERVR